MADASETSPRQRAALARIEDWTRRRFRLAAGDAVFATEMACAVPGCPPIHTVVFFWCEGERHQFKLFKRAADAGETDLPPAFLKQALAAAGEAFECC